MGAVCFHARRPAVARGTEGDGRRKQMSRGLRFLHEVAGDVLAGSRWYEQGSRGRREQPTDLHVPSAVATAEPHRVGYARELRAAVAGPLNSRTKGCFGTKSTRFECPPHVTVALAHRLHSSSDASAVVRCTSCPHAGRDDRAVSRAVAAGAVRCHGVQLGRCPRQPRATRTTPVRAVRRTSSAESVAKLSMRRRLGTDL